MTGKITIIALTITTCFSCTHTDTEKKGFVDLDTVVGMTTMNDRGIPLDTLEQKILNHGDTSAYDDLMIELLDYNIEERIKWAKIMADKYDYTRAYNDYLSGISLKCEPEPPFSCLTKNEKDTVAIFLKRAIEKGDSAAMEFKKEYNIK
jgi:hypothetical protein